MNDGGCPHPADVWCSHCSRYALSPTSRRVAQIDEELREINVWHSHEELRGGVYTAVPNTLEHAARRAELELERRELLSDREDFARESADEVLAEFLGSEVLSS